MSIKRIKVLLTYVGLVVLSFVLLFPLIYMFISSFKPLYELIRMGTGFFPQNPTFANYESLIFVRTPIRNFPLFLLNSLKVSLGTALLTVVISTLAGYGLARFQYAGRDILARSMLFLYVFPTVLLIIPIYMIFIDLGLIDTHLGLIFIYTGLSAPFCTWLLTSFFKSIPKEIEDAASVDGASKVTILLKIALPLAAPGIVTVGAYSFIIGWGEYLFASILLHRGVNRLATLGLVLLTEEQYIEWGPLLAGSTLIIIPVIILFSPVIKQFIKGFTAATLE